MVLKKQLLLQSIRKLLALSVLDEEILLNLKEVGINREEAEALIKEARLPRRASEKEATEEEFFEKFEKKEKETGEKRAAMFERAKKIEQRREEATEALAEEMVEPEEESAAEEIAEEIGSEEEPEEAEPNEEEPEEAEPAAEEREEAEPAEEEKLFGESGPIRFKEERPRAKLVEDISVSKLWEKGILAAVNQRLAEMRKLKEEIDSELDKKVAEANKREMEKLKVLFDSQRSLLVSKVDTEIEAKAKGFAEMIELKLREMRGLNKQIGEQIEKFKGVEKKSKVEGESLSRRLNELEKVKEDLVASLNSEIIKTKEQNKQLVEGINKKLKEMDDRINKTLQLENQIVEGLVREAEQKVSQMIESKAGGVRHETEKHLQDLLQMKASLEAEQRQKIATIEEQFKANRDALDSQLKQRLTKLDELQKAITVEFSPERFRLLMQELNEFKAQFVDAIKQNAEKYNEEINRINEQSQAMEKQFSLRAEKIDKKIAELDAFEKNFAKEIGVSLEKLAKKGNKK